MSPTLPERILSHGITATSRWDETLFNRRLAADFDRSGSAYRVTLRGRFDGCRRSLTVPFYMGSAHTDEPTAADVLQSLLSDASSADQSFEDWCGDYGYDTDSRKAEATYRAVQQQTRRLRAFLGDAYQAFVFETEGY